MIKCKCGGELKEEEMPATVEEQEIDGFVIGRCVNCARPYQFSKEMWKELTQRKEQQA